MKVAPYLIFSGQCEEALQTYARILGSKAPVVFYFENSPMAKQFPEMAKKVTHAWILAIR
jgi:PhnB protein